MVDPAKEESSKTSVLAVIGMCMAVVGAGVRGYQLWQKYVGSRPQVVQAPVVVPPIALAPEHAARLQPSAVPAVPTQVAPRRASLNVLAQDGTAELQALYQQSQISEAQLRALGVATLAAGSDLYATRVRIENTGTVPIQIYPQNLRMHYAGQAVAIHTIDHPSFLQSTVLKPKHYLTGLVVYRATIAVGGAIRLLGEGSYSYEDPSVFVTYGTGSR